MKATRTSTYSEWVVGPSPASCHFTELAVFWLTNFVEEARFSILPNEWPPDVVDFLRQHSAVFDFMNYAELAQDVFGGARTLTVFVDADPETQGREWVVLQVSVDGSAEQALQEYELFMARALEDIPDRSRGLFRLSLDLV